jgi:lycopene beta-cyclase
VTGAVTSREQSVDTVDTVDVAVVGGGGAGLALVTALEAASRRLRRRPPSVVVLDPVHRREPDRTWCWWTDDPGPLADRLTASWSRMALVGADGVAREYDLGPLRYVMLGSREFYAAADAALERLAAASGQVAPARRTAAVDRIEPGAEYAVVHAGDRPLRARWVFDSRPAPPRRPGSTFLLQHFRGWTVRFEQPVLDPGLATLMDFRLPQPGRGVAFAYGLPLDRHRALVEYTEFSPARLPSADYDRILTAYLADRWGVGPGRGVEVEAVEDGAIPMTDAPFARRAGHRVFRLGTAGGATRGSTGYTFATMNRQAGVIAEALLAGRPPVPPVPYPARHRWMDAVLLRALDRGYVDGPRLFTDLFARNPVERVVRFLDGRSGVGEELAVMRTAPMPAMLRAAGEDALARAGRRLGVTAAAATAAGPGAAAGSS